MSFEDQIKNEYFEWLYDYVCNGRAHRDVSYRKLFMYLHQTEFIFSIRNDVNRAKDGEDLRYRFGMIRDEDQVDEYLQILDGPCSVLEMMVALAVRCEETIMDDTRYGNRTGQWFWCMMSNIGIDRMTDDIFDREYVDNKVQIFLSRQYDPDGKGGLFHIRGCTDDLRDMEIWTQLCWFLDNY